MIKNLTGLRFFMAYWVVIYHVREAVNISIISEIINIGYFGVDVFFVLSGYILTYVYYDEFFLKKAIGFKDNLNFIKKRFARIYPLHLTTLSAAILFALLLHFGLDIKQQMYNSHIVPQLFLTHAWGIVSGIRWNFPSWSVSAEWFAYLFVFPVSYYLYHKTKISGLLVGVLFIFLIYVLGTFYYFNNDIGSQLDSGILRIIPEFMIGSAAYLWYWKNRESSKLVLSIYAALIILVYLFTDNFQYSFILMVPCFIIFLHRGNYILNIIFGSKPVVFLGEISYSIYMLHFFSRAISGIIQRNLVQVDDTNSALFFVNYTLLTIGLATFAYYIIEVPCRKYINSIRLFRS